MSSRGSDKRYADRTSRSSDKSSDKSYGHKQAHDKSYVPEETSDRSYGYKKTRDRSYGHEEVCDKSDTYKESSGRSYYRKEDVRPRRDHSTSTQKSGSWQRVPEAEWKEASGSEARASSSGAWTNWSQVGKSARENTAVYQTSSYREPAPGPSEMGRPARAWEGSVRADGQGHTQEGKPVAPWKNRKDRAEWTEHQWEVHSSGVKSDQGVAWRRKGVLRPRGGQGRGQDGRMWGPMAARWHARFWR